MCPLDINLYSKTSKQPPATLACNFTKSITPPGVFFTVFKLYKWCHILQSVTNKSRPILTMLLYRLILFNISLQILVMKYKIDFNYRVLVVRGLLYHHHNLATMGWIGFWFCSEMWKFRRLYTNRKKLFHLYHRDQYSKNSFYLLH